MGLCPGPNRRYKNQLNLMGTLSGVDHALAPPANQSNQSINHFNQLACNSGLESLGLSQVQANKLTSYCWAHLIFKASAHNGSSLLAR